MCMPKKLPYSNIWSDHTRLYLVFMCNTWDITEQRYFQGRVHKFHIIHNFYSTLTRPKATEIVYKNVLYIRNLPGVQGCQNSCIIALNCLFLFAKFRICFHEGGGMKKRYGRALLLISKHIFILSANQTSKLR